MIANITKESTIEKSKPYIAEYLDAKVIDGGNLEAVEKDDVRRSTREAFLRNVGNFVLLIGSILFSLAVIVSGAAIAFFAASAIVLLTGAIMSKISTDLNVARHQTKLQITRRDALHAKESAAELAAENYSIAAGIAENNEKLTSLLEKISPENKPFADITNKMHPTAYVESVTTKNDNNQSFAISA
ncbi:MAG: hypothetical protein AAF195_03830 [Pseudomonadota bacterium]